MIYNHSVQSQIKRQFPLVKEFIVFRAIIIYDNINYDISIKTKTPTDVGFTFLNIILLFAMLHIRHKKCHSRRQEYKYTEAIGSPLSLKSVFLHRHRYQYRQ